MLPFERKELTESFYICPFKREKMSESSAKSSQPLSAKQDKDVSEKRGRGRPRKQPQVCTVFSFPRVILGGSFCKMYYESCL